MNEDNTHYLDIPDYDNTVPTGETFDGVLEGHHYSADPNGTTTTLTYSFAGPGSRYDTNSYAGEGRNWPTLDLERLSDAEITAFENILRQLESITNLEFVHVEDGDENAGTIRPVWVPTLEDGWAGYAEAPFPARSAAGDIWLAKDAFVGAPLTAFIGVITHELGHAIGIKHPHEARGAFLSLNSDWDGREYSIMSYKLSAEHPAATSSNLGPITFMYMDILALQYLYGADTVTTAGNETYSYSQEKSHFLTIWDAGGIDTLEVTDGNRPVSLNLTPGTWNNVGSAIQYDTGRDIFFEYKTIFIPPEVLIENATGADGNDLITGNDADNTLKGHDGNDSMYGGAGNDALWAGKTDTGNDLLVGGAGDDTLGGGTGNDFIVGGDEQADGSDKLYGGDGSDTLIGGGWQDTVLKNKIFETGEAILTSIEADVIWAGSGNDLILAAAGNDTIGAGTGNDHIEAGGGDDRIFAYSGNDTVSAEDGNDLIFSGSGADSVNGGNGNDTLWGGSGNDTLTGGDGSDTFGFTHSSGTDVITEFDIEQDVLLLSETFHTFNTSADIVSKSTDTDRGVLIDLGDGTSLLLANLSTSDIDQISLA